MQNESIKLSKKSKQLFDSDEIQGLFDRAITLQELEEAKRIYHHENSKYKLPRVLIDLAVGLLCLVLVSLVTVVCNTDNVAAYAAQFLLDSIGIGTSNGEIEDFEGDIWVCIILIPLLIFGRVWLSWTVIQIKQRNLHKLDSSDLKRLQEVIEEAKRSDPEALYQVGKAFSEGDLFPFDEKASHLMYAFASELNHPKAALKLSEFYMLNNEIRARLIRHASKLGESTAVKQMLSASKVLDSGRCEAWRMKCLLP